MSSCLHPSAPALQPIECLTSCCHDIQNWLRCVSNLPRCRCGMPWPVVACYNSGLAIRLVNLRPCKYLLILGGRLVPAGVALHPALLQRPEGVWVFPERLQHVAQRAEEGLQRAGRERPPRTSAWAIPSRPVARCSRTTCMPPGLHSGRHALRMVEVTHRPRG